jgi:hypothetical protein
VSEDGSDDAASPRRPTLAIGPRGLVATWVGSVGPTVARLEAWSREHPVFVRGLGHPGADLASVPAVWACSDGIVVAWCEEDGAWVARLAWEDGAVSEPRLAIEGAREVAIASGPNDAVLFGADATGVVALTIGPDGSALAAPVRFEIEHRAGARIAAARVHDASLLVHVHPGVDAWTSVAFRRGRGVSVRHPLHAACTDAFVESAGGRAGVTLELEGGEARFGLLGADGKVIERPHAIFERGSAALGAPVAVWTENEWTVLAHERDAGQLRVQPTGGRNPAFTLPRCAGPFAASYYGKHIHALEAEPRGDLTELRLWRCARDGADPQQRILHLDCDDARPRRARRAVRRSLSLLSERISRARGYRDQRPSVTLAREGDSVVVVDDVGRTSLRVEADGEGLAVSVVSTVGEGGDAEETMSSLVRLASWVRQRFSSEARARAAAELAWATELASAIGAELESVDHAGPTLLLELRCVALPDPDELARWLRRVEEEQRARAIGSAKAP